MQRSEREGRELQKPDLSTECKMFLKKGGGFYKTMDDLKKPPNKAKSAAFDNKSGDKFNDMELRQVIFELMALGYGKQLPIKFTVAEEFIRKVSFCHSQKKIPWEIGSDVTMKLMISRENCSLPT